MNSDHICEVCNRKAIGEKVRYNADYDAYACKNCAEKVRDWMKKEHEPT